MNYTGDRLNFGAAAERAKAEGLRVEMVVTAGEWRSSSSSSGQHGLTAPWCVRCEGIGCHIGRGVHQVWDQRRAEPWQEAPCLTSAAPRSHPLLADQLPSGTSAKAAPPALPPPAPPPPTPRSTDDCALKAKAAVGRRGIAGTVLVHKIAGATAAAGGSLEEVRAAAEAAAASIGTMGASLSGCTVFGQPPCERWAWARQGRALGVGFGRISCSRSMARFSRECRIEQPREGGCECTCVYRHGQPGFVNLVVGQEVACLWHRAAVAGSSWHWAPAARSLLMPLLLLHAV